MIFFRWIFGLPTIKRSSMIAVVAAISAISASGEALAHYNMKPTNIAIMDKSIDCLRSKAAGIQMLMAVNNKDTQSVKDADSGAYTLEDGDVVEALHVDPTFIQVQFLTTRNGGASGKCWLPNWPSLFRAR